MLDYSEEATDLPQERASGNRVNECVVYYWLGLASPGETKNASTINEHVQTCSVLEECIMVQWQQGQ
jgi:hypothetical protein